MYKWLVLASHDDGLGTVHLKSVGGGHVNSVLDLGGGYVNSACVGKSPRRYIFK